MSGTGEEDAGPIAVVFVGGFGDRFSRLVAGYAFGPEGFARGHPTLQVTFFAWTQRQELLAFARRQPSAIRLRVAGHSYGADTAAQLAARLGKEGRALDLLLTADPVSRRSRPDLARVRQGARRWINLNATGGGPFEPSNVVARIGGAWRRDPHPFADACLDHPVPHAHFAALLRCRLPDGRTAEQALADPEPIAFRASPADRTPPSGRRTR